MFSAKHGVAEAKKNPTKQLTAADVRNERDVINDAAVTGRGSD